MTAKRSVRYFEMTDVVRADGRTVLRVTDSLAAPPEDIGPATEGDALFRLQQCLAYLGHLDSALVNGVWCDATGAGIRRFQASASLKQDASYGQLSRTALSIALGEEVHTHPSPPSKPKTTPEDEFVGPPSELANEPKTLNEHVLAVINSIPRGGGYQWPATKGGNGCLEDVVFKKETLLHAGTATPPNTLPPTYCCGLTLEIYFRALVRAGVELPITFAQAREIQRRWFITKPEYRKGPVVALTERKLGTDTSNDPRPGDFAQFWRSNGSGHSVIVLDYDKKTKALRYFSTQSSTNGPGERTESPPELYTARATISTNNS